MLPIDFFFRAVRRHADRIAIETDGETLRYAELGARVNAFASALQQLDPQAGSRVAVSAGNTVDHIVAVLAVLAAEKTWVPLNARNAPAELDRALAFTAPTIVVAEPEHSRRLALDASMQLVAVGEPMHALIAAHAGREPLRGRAGPEDVQAIKFTGGSTGVPKGVMQPCRAWTAGLLSQIHEWGLDAHDIYLVAAPVTHGTSTYLLPILAQGGRLLLPRDNKPATLVEAFRARGATLTFMPPTLIYMLMAELGGKAGFPRLRHLIYGGAPMPPEKIRLARECFGPVLATTYGQTEAPQIVTVMRAEDFEDEANWPSVGRPALMADVGIMDPQGRLLPAGEIGEVVVRGDLVMTGYWKQPEKTAETLIDGWLHTGDGGYLDARGYLFLRDRLREVVITGGFNVYPIDVESVLDRHPAVHESAVFGIDDDKWGEAVQAAVQLRPGMQADEASIIAFAKEQLGSVKAPKRIHFYESLPRSVAGKVHKPTLKAEAKAKAGAKSA